MGSTNYGRWTEGETKLFKHLPSGAGWFETSGVLAGLVVMSGRLCRAATYTKGSLTDTT